MSEQVLDKDAVAALLNKSDIKVRVVATKKGKQLRSEDGRLKTERRTPTADHIVSFAEQGENVVVVTSDGQKHQVVK